MLLKVFRDNQPFTILFLFLLSAIVWSLIVLNKSFEPGVHVIYNYSVFYLFPSLRSINNNIHIATALNLLIILFTGFYLSRLTIRHQLFPNRNLLPMLAFFLLSLPFFTEYTGFSYTLLTLPILLYVIDRLFESAEKKKLSFSFFNGAAILSLASLINYFLLFYLLFIFFLYFRLRGTHWREFVFVILGALLPYVVLFSLMYLFNSDISDFIESIGIVWQFNIDFHTNFPVLVLGGFILLLFFISSWKAMNQYVKMKILTRKFSVSFFVFFLLSLIMVFGIPFVNHDSFFFLAAPLSFLFAYYFNTCRINIVNQTIFALYIMGTIALFGYSLF